MEASIDNLYQKELAFLNKNFKQGSVIEEKFYGMFYGGQDNLDSVLESLTNLSSASFVRQDSHSKTINHNRYSKPGKFLTNDVLSYREKT